MRYGEDWWTRAEADDGVMPHTAVWDPASGVYREVIEDDDEEEIPLLHSPLRSDHKGWALTTDELGLTEPVDREATRNG